MFQVINNKVMLTKLPYEIGKRFVQIWIPAFSTLYFGLGKIWGWPSIEEVVGSLAIVATFLGTGLRISTRQYDASGAALNELEDAIVHDGDLVIEEKEDGRKLMTLDLENAPEGFEKKGSISFKVVRK